MPDVSVAETTQPPEGSAVEQTLTPHDSRKKGHAQVSEWIARFALVSIFAGMVLVFAILRPESFATMANLQTILNGAAVLTIFACAVTVVLLAGEFDLSFPYVADSSALIIGVLVTTTMASTGASTLLAVVIGIVVATGFGLVNGFAVALGKVPSFVATLAVGSIAAGIELATQGKISGGLKQISTMSLPESLQNLGTMTIGSTDLRLGVLVAGIVALVTWVLLRFTVFGRHVLAVGGNAEAAFLASVPVARTRIAAFAYVGLLAGIASIIGLIQRGYYNGASPGLLLQAYTVAFLGTAFLAMRRFTILGTIVAVLFIQTLANGLALLNEPTWIVSVVNGVVLLAAVVLTRRRGRV
jgi:ribose transport system permease protein